MTPTAIASLAAYIVPAAGADVDPANLRTHLKKSLPDYMLPSAYVRVDSLPLTLNGKLDTRMLPRPSRDHLTLVSAFAAPRTTTEEWLATFGTNCWTCRRSASMTTSSCWVDTRFLRCGCSIASIANLV